MLPNVEQTAPCAKHEEVMKLKSEFIAKWGVGELLYDAISVEQLIEKRKRERSGHFR